MTQQPLTGFETAQLAKDIACRLSCKIHDDDKIYPEIEEIISQEIYESLKNLIILPKYQTKKS